MSASTIPTSREHLVEMVRSAFAKLDRELVDAGPEAAELPCVDDWSVKDLLAVRAWWTESVVRWIRAGNRGQHLELPAPGYAWRETPRLNADIVAASQSEPFERIVDRLRLGFREVLATIDDLDDRELLEPGVFEWAGKYPIGRWISLNTSRQYTTARTYIRRALREAAAD